MLVMEPQKQKIVIVEDNQALAEVYKTRLELLGYQCFSAFDGEEALAVIELQKPDLVLLDLMIPKIAGDEVLKRMRATDWGKDIRVYIISLYAFLHKMLSFDRFINENAP